jgi:hypothetical protein
MMELVRVDALASGVIRSGTTGDSVVVGSPMPTPAPPVRTPPARQSARPTPADEILVPDLRAELTPAQTVERRLETLLKGSALRVSHVRLAARLGRKP